MERIRVEKIPEDAFRKSLANALIHRTWNVNAHIRIMMLSDRIKLSSPGGLPFSLSEEEYLKGAVFILRNPILAHVFYRIHIVEVFGTGIVRIKEAYQNNGAKPVFEILENSINVVLPILSNGDFTEDEALVYGKLSKSIAKSISEISEALPIGRTKTIALLKNLASINIVSVIGNGRGTKYKL